MRDYEAATDVASLTYATRLIFRRGASPVSPHPGTPPFDPTPPLPRRAIIIPPSPRAPPQRSFLVPPAVRYAAPRPTIARSVDALCAVRGVQPLTKEGLVFAAPRELLTELKISAHLLSQKHLL